MNYNNLKWKTLSSEYVYKDNWLRARKEKCERPDGKIVYPYYVMEYPQWVAALGLTVDNKVVLVRQYRHALGEVCLELPGGCVDASDTDFEEAIKREFIEETGYKFTDTTYLGRTSANPSTNSNVLHMYLLTGGEKVQEQKLDANEEIEVLVVDFEEFKNLLLQNQFIQSMHTTTILFALQKLNKIQFNL